MGRRFRKKDGNLIRNPLVLPSTPTDSEDEKVLAWDKDAGAFEYVAQGGGGGVDAGRCAIVTPSGITPVSAYEIHTADKYGGKFLRLARRMNFPIARNVALASPEYGWLWNNMAALDSANENSTTANALYLDHGNTATYWHSSTQSAPFRHKVYTRTPGDHQVFIARINSDGDANREMVQLMVCANDNPGNYIRIGPGYDGGIKCITHFNSSKVRTAITQAQRDDGIWVMIAVHGRSAYALYNLTNQATPPTSGWVMTRYVATNFTTSTGRVQLRAGIVAVTENTNDSLTGNCLYYDDELAYARAVPMGVEVVNPRWGATQFDQNNTTQQILTDYDMGSDVAPEIGVLRNILTDIQNQLRGDGGTWQFSFIRDAGTGVGVGSWYAANAIVDAGSGKYWNLGARGAPAGADDGGSLQLPFLIPVAA